MYKSFFGLRERPFELTPDPGYLLLTSAHREALSVLQYGIFARKGLLVLTGEAGTGKTTLLHAAAAKTNGKALLVTMSNPRLTRAEFIETVVHGFGLPPAAAQSKSRMLEELHGLLLQELERDRACALIVDEAHALSDELLEEVRLLANLETDVAKLVSIVLAGQPELAERLNRTEHRHLKQRVAHRCALRPLTLQETLSFVASRVHHAGGTPSAIFTLEAVQACHAASAGIPRLVCVICDNALISAYAVGEKPVTAARVLEVCRDLDIEAGGAREAAPATTPTAVVEPIPVAMNVTQTEAEPVATRGRVDGSRFFRWFTRPGRTGILESR